MPLVMHANVHNQLRGVLPCHRVAEPTLTIFGSTFMWCFSLRVCVECDDDEAAADSVSD